MLLISTISVQSVKVLSVTKLLKLVNETSIKEENKVFIFLSAYKVRGNSPMKKLADDLNFAQKSKRRL